MKKIIGTDFDGWGRARLVFHGLLFVGATIFIAVMSMSDEDMTWSAAIAGASVFCAVLVGIIWLISGLLGWVYRGFVAK